MKASQEEKSTEFGLFEQNLQVEQLYFSIIHPGWDYNCEWHTRDLMDLLQGLVKTGKCEIVKQERSKFVSFLFLRERWRGLFVKHFSPPKSWSTGSTMLTLTQGASSSSSVVWPEGGTSKINVSRIIFWRERCNICLSGSPTTWTAQQPQSCRSRSKPLLSTAPTPRPSTTPGATSD